MASQLKVSRTDLPTLNQVRTTLQKHAQKFSATPLKEIQRTASLCAKSLAAIQNDCNHAAGRNVDVQALTQAQTELGALTKRIDAAFSANHHCVFSSKDLVVPIMTFLDLKDLGRLACANTTGRDNKLRALHQKLGELRRTTYLELCDYQQALGLPPDNWKDLFKYCTHLTSIDCSQCFSTKKLKGLIPHLPPSLRELDSRLCSAMSNPDLKMVVAKCTHLRDVDLTWSSWPTDETLEILSMQPGLTSLGLGGCNKITNSGLKKCLPKWTKLTYLNLHNCDWVTDETAPILVAHGGFIHLGLAQCNNMTIRGFRVLLLGCQKLMHLSLSSCPLVNDHALSLLAQCGRLLSLDIGGNNITDKGLRTLLCGCRQLSHLSLWNSKWVKNDTLPMIRKYAPALTYLNLQRCDFCTIRNVKALQASRPKLTIRR